MKREDFLPSSRESVPAAGFQGQNQQIQPVDAIERQCSQDVPTALYRHFDADGVLLYVGITANPKRRLYEHKCRSRWAEQIDRVDVSWLRCRTAALAAEAEAIRTEQPIFNGGGDEFFEPTGDALRDWMKRTGTRQADIADAFGVSVPTISQVINGQRKAPLRFAVMVEDMSGGEVPVRYWLFGATMEPNKSSRGASQ